jgi:sn-glycerol 3-phosphate transport system substrate-binding protein
VPAVAGYYTAPNGQMLSFPFNSSTTVFHYNKDAFKAAGLTPRQAAHHLARSGAGRRQAQGQRPQVPVHHQLAELDPAGELLGLAQREFATKNNGFGRHGHAPGVQQPLHVRHIENLANMAKQGLFVYKGRNNAADATFVSGECAMATGSSALYGSVKRNAKFAYGIGTLPYYPDVPGRAAEHRDRRRQPVGDGGQEARGVQGRGRSSSTTCPTPRCRPRATSAPATCRSPRPPSS